MSFAIGKFNTELNQIESFLKFSSLLDERNYLPNDNLDVSVYRKYTYKENWENLIKDNIYNFYLTDNSIFVFKLNSAEKKISFSYYDCPYECMTYKEFLHENGVKNLHDKTFRPLYEDYLNNECGLKEHPVTFRYDLDFDSYLSGLHPVSHLHVGFKNNTRIGVDKIFNVITFVSLVFRQHYPAYWKLLIEEQNEFFKRYAVDKNKLDVVDKKYWNKPLDDSEMYLT